MATRVSIRRLFFLVLALSCFTALAVFLATKTTPPQNKPTLTEFGLNRNGTRHNMTSLPPRARAVLSVSGPYKRGDTDVVNRTIVPPNNVTASFLLNPTPIPYRAQVRRRTLKNRYTERVILLWNDFLSDPEFGLELGTHVFESTKCTHTCRISSDSGDLATADAVIVDTFHHLKDLSDVRVPTRTSLDQIFVFLNLENPVRSYPGLFNMVSRYIDTFNLTMTYLNRPETDIWTPYGEIRKRSSPDPFAVPSLTYVRNKTKSVLWLVSNCQAPSSRYEYVDLLSKHIQVDIFGKCGADSCPKGELCLESKDRDYLFYLAFENGYCRDYITEKTFRTLANTNMVPVVLGGGNYTRYLPNHSYIDVRDYPSPSALADHLKRLMTDRHAYLTYLQWKQDFSISSPRAMRRHSMCRLCQLLNTPEYLFKTRYDPLGYWTPDLCLTGDDEREAVHIF